MLMFGVDEDVDEATATKMLQCKHWHVQRVDRLRGRDLKPFRMLKIIFTSREEAQRAIQAENISLLLGGDASGGPIAEVAQAGRADVCLLPPMGSQGPPMQGSTAQVCDL